MFTRGRAELAMLTRRDVCRLAAAAPLVVAGRAPAWTLIAVPDERVVLVETMGAMRLTPPALHSRVVASFALAGRSCAAVRFASPFQPDGEFEILAIVGNGRILGLEPWRGRAAGGAHFSTRLELLPAGRGVVLRREAAVPNSRLTVWRREVWADVLVADGAGLADSPVRAPRPDTFQSAMAGRRARVLDRLTRPYGALDATLVALATVWPWEEGAAAAL